MKFVTDEHDPLILRHWFRHYYKRSLPDVNFVMSIDAHQGVLSCIRLGMGLGITSKHLIQSEIDIKKIVPIFPEKKKVVNYISLVQLRNKKSTLTEQTFQDYLKLQMKDTSNVWGDNV